MYYFKPVYRINAKNNPIIMSQPVFCIDFQYYLEYLEANPACEFCTRLIESY